MIERNHESELHFNKSLLNFVDEVSKTFFFLADFGFRQTEASATIARYQNDKIEATIYLGRNSHELGFEIVHDNIKYSMSELIRLADAQLAKKYQNSTVRTQAGLNAALIKLALLVRQYAEPALKGISDVFPALNAQRKAWGEEFELDVLEGQLRPKANYAFQHGDYQEAIKLYERIFPRLTPSERKKLSYAKSHF